MFFVYILYSEKLDRYYIGSTGNLEDRLTRHNAGRSTFTKTGIPWVIKYTENYTSKSEAMQREYFLKRMKSRVFLEKLFINS